jgi:hypothetical protein
LVSTFTAVLVDCVTVSLPLFSNLAAGWWSQRSAHMKKGTSVTSFAKIRSCLTAAVCLLAPLFCSAQGSARHNSPFFISFQVPQSTATFPLSINDRLSVTGYYRGADGQLHGFVRHVFGEITSFDVAGSITTLPVGINNAGEITGTYQDAAGVDGGFIRSPEGKITTFNPGGSGGFTTPRAISAGGMVVGQYSTTNSVPPAFGFIRYPDGGMVTFGIAGSTYVNPQSINDAGEITGQYYYQGNTQVGGFVRYPNGEITTFDYAEGIVPLDINQVGTVTGWFGTTGFHGFVRSAKGEITPFDPPGPIQTQYISVSRSGEVAGSYSNGLVHGFLRSPQGRILSFDPPGAINTTPTSIDDIGVVTGSYISSSGEMEGFLRIPQFDCDDEDPQREPLQ